MKYNIINKYYTGEPVHIYIQSLINIMQDNNWFIITKNGKGNLPLFCGNGEQVIPIYASLLMPTTYSTTSPGSDTGGPGAHYLNLTSTCIACNSSSAAHGR